MRWERELRHTCKILIVKPESKDTIWEGNVTKDLTEGVLRWGFMNITTFGFHKVRGTFVLACIVLVFK